ncbi:MAG: PEP-CTERM sorting domain-containing protein [Phycisphaerales bacterium]|jgi:hypothetical protein|nr:PEP-CTERM sorting domain-containing protein [Phycisphaerales bacterium]
MKVTATIKNVVAFTIICLICANASAAMYSLQPYDRDLGDLDHYRNYTWGINTPWDITPDENLQYETVVSATLSFDNIRNWDNEPNVLYIHLLDWARRGVEVNYDGQAGGDAFDGLGVDLITYTNLPATSQDLSYSFDQDEIDALNNYAFDGRFGLAFDPDCHFYNSGVTLDIVTETGTTPVPEPATMSLLALGGLAILRRRNR